MAGESTEVRVDVEGRVLRLTNLEKVLHPGTGTTKAEVLQHYASVAPLLLPLLRGRCVTRIRWPHGVGGPSFFEKNAPAGTPSWVRVVEVGDGVRFPMVEDLATLTWLVNLSAIELHVPQWRVDDGGAVLPPDRLVVDLDPGEPAGLGECAHVALAVRDRLSARDASFETVPVLSGSKGIHVYADLTGRADEFPDSDAVTRLARALAEELQRAAPTSVTASMAKQRRRGKVFVDWSQNSASKTTLSPWSLRGREHPTCAVPVSWTEVEALAADPLALEQVTLADVPERAYAAIGAGFPLFPSP
ncbi:non-homologous end-joining DNA ligase [Nocardioides yefusunii]|uniref:Non-homologous end-joining DNA ligase n=1 Tax=Nocardioides yefusunii TaxID=2500546 RepID=A0ABW1QW92_9ACTN|nr:non-homologous end-joining DNA ligase [Nocardioides yefusunii]